MTNQEFWSQLNRLAKKEDFFDAVDLIRQAYKEDLGVICACTHKDPDTVYQLYVNMDNGHPDSDHNIIAPLEDGVITLSDLEDFSEDLRESMAFVTRER